MIRLIILLLVILLVWNIFKLIRQAAQARRKSGHGHLYPESYYAEVLGISEGAGPEEIKEAYRNKIKEHHPDRFQNQPEWVKKQAAETTQKINEAYAWMRRKKK